MSQITLFEQGDHRNILLENFDAGAGVQCNQHVIVDGNEAMILDPGGHKLYMKVFAAAARARKGAKLRWVFLSHQDPDIVAAVNGWLMTTDAHAVCSSLWKRFVPHFGSDRLVFDRVIGLPDEGGWIPLGSTQIQVLPAHYLHSCGNFHVYDGRSKILYTGDLGVGLGGDYRIVPNFDEHIPTMEGFHRRYMSSTAALRAWVVMARQLDVETIAPQHGAVFQGRAMVERFLDWCDSLQCGIESYPEMFTLPGPQALRVTAPAAK